MTERRGVDVHPLIARILSGRGIGPEDYEAFFDTSVRRLMPAEKIPGIPEAAEVIMPFVRTKRRIVVFGDYDCDGVCAAAILVTALRLLGGDADAFVPDRFKEGYGMTAASVERMLADNPGTSLVITVDNGISSAAEVADLKARGIAVVVTDHHLPPETLPQADAILETKIAMPPDCENLCGAGLAFFLAEQLIACGRREGLCEEAKCAGPFLVLAGLATVADVMPLTAQNRILVASAVRYFDRMAPAGLLELRNHAAKRSGPVTSRDFGFLLAPRINAAGRMASAREAYELLIETDRERARLRAVAVDTHNAERRTEETRIADEALEQIGRNAPEAVVVHGESWHSGVIGIVAARLCERYGVPVAVLAGVRGSARAPEGYDVHAALEQVSDTLARFGGHAQAGGFDVRPERFEEFRERFVAACAAQAATADAVRTEKGPDLWIEPTDITLELSECIRTLEPFGEGNMEPCFGLRSVIFSDIRLVGMDGRHLSFGFSDRRIPRAVWWGHGPEAEVLRRNSGEAYDIVFKLATSDWGGEEPHPELRIERICKSGT